MKTKANTRAIDPWVNVSMGDFSDSPYLNAVKNDYFQAGEEFFRNIDPDELLAMMDQLGVDKSLITVNASDPKQRVLDFTRRHPGRFFLAVIPDLTRGMQGIWEMERLAED